MPSTETLVYAQTDLIVPGLVLHIMADGTGALPGVAPTGTPYGIWLREDHDYAPFVAHTGEPSALAISMIQRGRIIALASGICTSGGPVRYSDDGTVSDAGAYALPHARFASPDYRVTQSASVVAVELQSPFAA